MKVSRHKDIRTILRAQPDGLSVVDICAQLNAPNNTVRTALHNMPDAYIDRWVVKGRGIPYAAVWCVVVPPANCPHPRSA